MRLRAVLLAVLVLGAALPVLAGGTWYEYYLDAIEKDIPKQNWAAALEKLKQARTLKPQSGLNEATYGLNYVNYLPYYYTGLAYYHSGEHLTAILYFNDEEQRGAIKKTKLHGDLKKLRHEAQIKVDAEQKKLEEAKRVRTLREEVARYRREGW